MKSIASRIEELEARLAAEIGPHGGKIIGKTRTGKPIYKSHNSQAIKGNSLSLDPRHNGWSEADHHDAIRAHSTKAQSYLNQPAGKQNIPAAQSHLQHANRHKMQLGI